MEYLQDLAFCCFRFIGMSFLHKLPFGFGRKKTPEVTQTVSTVGDQEVQPVTERIEPASTEKNEAEAGVGVGFPEDTKEVPSEDAQRGVQRIEAVTLVWTKKSLAGMLISYVCPQITKGTFTYYSYSIWMIFFTNGMKLSILASLTPYVTSSFQSHSLLTVIGIVADAMAAATYIPMAKLLDVWGRAEGFALTVAFSTLGLVLMAVSQNLATFCAAQVSSNNHQLPSLRDMFMN